MAQAKTLVGSIVHKNFECTLIFAYRKIGKRALSDSTAEKAIENSGCFLVKYQSFASSDMIF